MDSQKETSEAQSPSQLELLERYVPTLQRAVRQNCPQWLAPQADDIVQAALVKIATMRKRSEEKREFPSSYLWQVVHSVIVDEIRRHRRRREDALNETEAHAQIVSTAADPERSMLATATGEGIVDCLQQLPKHRRQAVTLRLLGHSIREVATLLSFPKKRADNLVYRGLAALRECLRRKGLEP